MKDLINIVESKTRVNSTEFPNFGPGDTVIVYTKIKEGNKERIQKFQGTVIKRKNIGSNNETFSVRKISSGVGVERLFSTISPSINKIEVTRYGSVRRSKLYYLRGNYGKSAIVKEKRTSNNSSSK